MPAEALDILEQEIAKYALGGITKCAQHPERLSREDLVLVVDECKRFARELAPIVRRARFGDR